MRQPLTVKWMRLWDPRVGCCARPLASVGSLDPPFFPERPIQALRKMPEALGCPSQQLIL
jgi:hypothetical protein